MPSREITFHGGTRTALGFVVAFTLVLVALMPVKEVVVDSPEGVEFAFDIAKFGLFAGIALVALRREGVGVADLGLSSRHVLPAVGAFGGAWVALNVLGVGLAAATGHQWGLGLLRETTPLRWETVPAPRLTTLLYYFLVVGMVEEFVFRGYFQTKVVALLGDGTRSRVTLGIVTASLAFGLGHVPGAMVAGASVRGALSAAALSAVSGIAFGILYEATQNVYFVGLLHGFGDTWPLVVDWTNWSGSALGAYLVGILVIYAAATLAYRYWANGADLTLAVQRSESGGAVASETPKVKSE